MPATPPSKPNGATASDVFSIWSSGGLDTAGITRATELMQKQGVKSTASDIAQVQTTVPLKYIDTKDIYGSLDAASIELRTALTLLPEALRWIDSALESIGFGEPIHADDAMQHVQAIMPELFCCRRLGDGFGAIVNAVQSSLENLHGEPLLAAQIRMIRAALERVFGEPVITFDAAMDQVDKLESAGLIVDPKDMESIEELLDD